MAVIKDIVDIGVYSQRLDCGGGAGHMSHPYDVRSLTFNDMKEIVRRALEGELNLEKEITEKLDGQNILVSWKNNKLIAARNQGHIKNQGEKALDRKGIEDKFAGRGDISDAFNFAMRDLESAIAAINPKEREKVFKEGAAFANLEVLFPATTNVIPYGRKLLTFHGVLTYDEKAKVISSDNPKKLQALIDKVEARTQDTYEIVATPVVELPKIKNSGKIKERYVKDLDTLQKRFKLSSTDTLNKYHEVRWGKLIEEAANSAKYVLSQELFNALLNRWVNSNKTLNIRNIKSMIDNEKFLAWVIKTDKESGKIYKKYNKPFDTLFLGLGAEVLQNIKSAVSANPDEAIRKMTKDLDKVIADLKKSNDPVTLEKMGQQLARLEAMGGINAIVPIEGIVFTYKGNVMKLTGTFAPVNQILGVLKYAR